MQFKIGDVVQLKSGGPQMTVVVVAKDGDVHVVWFNGESGNFEPKRFSFPAETLMPVKEQSWQ